MPLSAELESRLELLARALVDQSRARPIVPAQQQSTGFWFGGGNMVQTPDGHLHVVGRYRNHGDSRTGVAAGERGLELAIFESADSGASWSKSVSWSKSDLDVAGRPVLSIEGSSLHLTDDGVELFVSTEKDGIGHPSPFEDYLKPGTGVWTIERLAARSVAGLKDSPLLTVAECHDPQWLHIKDPFVYDRSNGQFALLFCSHPFSWSSSNTGYALREATGGEFGELTLDFFPRGTTWDVAMTRGTCIIDVPRIGAFAGMDTSLVFYDGGESLRNLDEHNSAVKRPRGYSCEELGCVAYIQNGELNRVNRLSKYLPFFVSPYGTGCSRYVDVLKTDNGLIATWQQSQNDLSQPLVMNSLSNEEVSRLLS